MQDPTTNHDFSIAPVSLSRRRLLAAASGLLAAPYVIGARAAERRLVVRDGGGPYVPAFTAAFYKPFQEATGIEIVNVQAQHEPTSIIKAMVDNKNYTWDMAHLTLSASTQLRESGYLEPLNIKGRDWDDIPAKYKNDYFAATDVFAVVLAYRTDTFKTKGLPEPKGWTDFFDVKGRPVRRGMRRHPFDNMEIALMADGVPMDKLYPLDFDRAYRKLDTIKKSIDVWWDGGAQTSQMLKSGEIDMTPAFNARAQAAIDDGAPVKIVWDQNIWVPEGFSILKGGPKVDMCRQFAAFTSDPKRQAAFTKDLAYGPVNPKAYEFVPKARAADLPTAPQNTVRAVQVNDAFWAKVKDKEIERFNAWVVA